MSLLWSHKKSDKFQCIIPNNFSQLIAFSEQVCMVTNQLLQEGSETWDWSHSINKPLCDNVIACDQSPFHTTSPVTIDNYVIRLSLCMSAYVTAFTVQALINATSLILKIDLEPFLLNKMKPI